MNLTHWAPLLLVTAFFIWVWPNPRTDNRTRTAMAVVCVLVGYNYLYWRLTSTVLGHYDKTWIEQTWVFTVWLVEAIGYIEITIFLLIMSRYCDRTPDADRFEQQDMTHWPSVDVFIPTYNEPIDVLEKTTIGAKYLDYPNKTVYVLDDGRRQWLREFCESVGVEYVTRYENNHAKAGNMNNGLRSSSGDLVAIFDADFVPGRNFLKRTVGFFQDRTVGIVQTPQHFFNKDPVQTNLNLSNEFPDEQRLFFDEMAASRDAWGVAFCCGSCSIARREALDQIGGFPTASITEDLLTTLTMLRKGYRTIYLNEKLSQGLAADSIKGFFVQRQRWCQGAIQCMYLKEGPLGPGLPLMQRILFFPISWLTMYPTRFMLVTIPLMYFYFNLVPLYFTSVEDLMFYQMPVFLAFFLNMRWMVGGKYMPVVSVAASVFASVRMIPIIIMSLVKPFGAGFKVTPKGSDAVGQRGADMTTFWVIFGTIILTVVGIVINVVPEYSVIKIDGFFPVGVIWALLNIIILIVAAMLCFEGPRYRQEERFTINEPVVLQINDQSWSGVLVDASASGCKIQLTEWWPNGVDFRAEVDFPDVGVIQLKPVRVNRGAIMFTFELTGAQRELMIRKLFSGQYDNAVAEIKNYTSIVKKLWQRGYH